VDWVDLELRALWFPDGLEARKSPLLFREEGLDGSRGADFTGEAKYRAHAPSGDAGPWEGDLRVRLRENLYLLGEAEYEPDFHRMLTTAEGIRWYSVPTLSLYLGRRVIARDSDIWTASADWFVSERWGLHLEQQVDTRDDGGLLTEIGLRRVWHDFVLEVFFERDGSTGDVSLGFNFLPTALWDPPTSAEKLGKLDFEAQRWYR
jgi:hypothetical protein